ncbi:MAG: hypothetical protein FJZ78_08940 [Bacteroidetes bacterium]|nr:hypothetical protein [Bacteroidota bacterium]
MIRILICVFTMASGLIAYSQETDSTASEIYYSIREREEINIDDLLSSIEASPLPVINSNTTPPGVPQALDVVKQLTTVTLPAGSPNQTSQLRILAATVASYNLELAQAFLLEAERIKPDEPETRISLAGLLIAQGYPRTALTLLGPTAPPESLKLNGRRSVAAAWNLAKGVAHLTLRETQKSIPFLKKAIEQDGSLTEASKSLAKAQSMAGNKTEARQTLKKGAWRQRGTARWNKNGNSGVLPYHKVYDINRGRFREMEEFEFPQNAAQLISFYELLEDRSKQLNVQSVKVATELIEVVTKMSDPKILMDTEKMPNAHRLIAAEALGPIGNTMGITPLNTQWDPGDPAAFTYSATKNDYADDLEEISRRDHALSMKQGKMIEQMLVFMDVHPATTERITKEFMSRKWPEKREENCRALIGFVNSKLPGIYNNIVPLDAAITDWYKTSYKISSAIAQHLPEGLLFDQTQVTLESLSLQLELFRLANIQLTYSSVSLLDGCEEFVGPLVPVPPMSEKDKRLKACNDFTSGISVKFKIPKANGKTLMEVGLSCEKISLKGDIWTSGILSAKAGVEYKPNEGTNGELTGLVGVAAELPGGVSAEVDTMITFDAGDGTIQDLTVQGNVEGGKTIDEINGIEMAGSAESGVNIIKIDFTNEPKGDAMIYVGVGGK